jgi:hypothetical protein
MLLFAKSNTIQKGIKKQLMERYKMTDLGMAKTFLGFEISRDRCNHTVTIHQAKYIKSILGRFGMERANGVHTPMVPGSVLVESTNGWCTPNEIRAYQQVVGSIMYAMTSTRPDLAFTMSRLSKFNANPNYDHQDAAKHALRYLRKTTEVGITYGGSNVKVLGYSDSDFGADKDNRKSTAGYIFTVNGGAISWKSKQQGIVALSTMEAEYVGISEAGREAIWIKGLYNDVNQFVKGRMHPPVIYEWQQIENPGCKPVENEPSSDEEPMTIYGDNQAANGLTEDPKHHDRSKAIDVKFHWIRAAIKHQQIRVEHLPTSEMTADIMTKALAREKHERFMEYMGMKCKAHDVRRKFEMT